MTPPPLTWVVGAGGLLGRAVVAECSRRGLPTVHGSVPWSERAAVPELQRQLTRFLSQAGDRPWRIAWCAGSGVTSTGPELLEQERQVFTDFLAHLAVTAPGVTGRGALFLASSAGGLYAGSGSAPYTETSTPRPLTPYGFAKLEMEYAAEAFARDTGVPVLVGRIANLYGPGQNLAKPQGLISQLCRSELLGQPLSVFVPLDTLRDYLYVEDCAAMVVAGLDGLAAEVAGAATPMMVKIFASRRGTSIGAVLAEFRRVLKRRPRVVLGSSPYAAGQALDLRMDSRCWPELDAFAQTSLAVGIRNTYDDVRRNLDRTSVVAR